MKIIALLGLVCSIGLLAFGIYDVATIGNGWTQILFGSAGLVIHALYLRPKRTPSSRTKTTR
ncbi:hypothetical protein [Streptosporangium sp. NPDC051022]|uniref:hypothetical protein n=1 Tax=Streptosporangium sp. NPDC051022 TaxID=3155752 RepID=UPI0034458DE6